MMNRTPTYSCPRSKSMSTCVRESFMRCHVVAGRIHLREGSVSLTARTGAGAVSESIEGAAIAGASVVAGGTGIWGVLGAAVAGTGRGWSRYDTLRGIITGESHGAAIAARTTTLKQQLI